MKKLTKEQIIELMIEEGRARCFTLPFEITMDDIQNWTEDEPYTREELIDGMSGNIAHEQILNKIYDLGLVSFYRYLRTFVEEDEYLTTPVETLRSDIAKYYDNWEKVKGLRIHAISNPA